LPILKDRLPAGEGDVIASKINLSEAVLIWKIIFFSLARIMDVTGSIKNMTFKPK
jgi:hypothetical protein